MQVPVKNTKGETVDTLKVSDRLFGSPMNRGMVYQAMVMYLANQRQGTHKTKTRSEVSGGGRKPWRQKYVNKARQGSIRSPQWRHGGIAFGPRPRDYRQDMPKKMRHLALFCMLSDKLREGKLILVDNVTLPAPKTKEMAQVLAALNMNTSVLVVTRKPDNDVIRASGNIKAIRTLPVDLINAGELLAKDNLLMTLGAVKRAEELWDPQRVSSGAVEGQE